MGSAIGEDARGGGGSTKPTISNHDYNASNTKYATGTTGTYYETKNNEIDDNEPADEIDNDHEQLPMTQLSQPNYERQFKSTILKPLYNILDSSLKQDEIL